MWNIISSLFENKQTTNDISDDVQYNYYIPKDEIKNIHERIRNCLNDDDLEYNNIDDTLKIMRDETEKWYNPTSTGLDLNIDYNDVISKDSEDMDVDDDDDLLGYCLRLERNNEYLLQLVEKFEQVSFKKRYTELVSANENLRREYNHLKSSNSKVYSSYCDLVEQIKAIKLENSTLKKKINQSKDMNKSVNQEIEKLKLTINNLTFENNENLKKLKAAKNLNSRLEKDISEKESEIIKLNGVNIATKLKLERAESMLLKQENVNNNNINNTNKENQFSKSIPNSNNNKIPHSKLEDSTWNKSDEEEIESVDEIDDTISLLKQKYQTKMIQI